MKLHAVALFPVSFHPAHDNSLPLMTVMNINKTTTSNQSAQTRAIRTRFLTIFARESLTLHWRSITFRRPSHVREEKGVDWKFDLKAVYGVFFLNFRMTDLPHKLYMDVVLADRDTHAA